MAVRWAICFFFGCCCCCCYFVQVGKQKLILFMKHAITLSSKWVHRFEQSPIWLLSDKFPAACIELLLKNKPMVAFALGSAKLSHQSVEFGGILMPMCVIEKRFIKNSDGCDSIGIFVQLYLVGDWNWVIVSKANMIFAIEDDNGCSVRMVDSFLSINIALIQFQDFSKWPGKNKTPKIPVPKQRHGMNLYPKYNAKRHAMPRC